ncbi:MAG TPA: thioredoxin domain-containing protein [Kofleriaceae bacterium]
MIRVALVLVVVACSSTEELEKKVTKLEEDVSTLRKERQFLEVKQVELLKQMAELDKKVDDLGKRNVPPPSPYRPTRKQPDPMKTYSLAIDPLDPVDGASDALVTIVEAYEYACPYCEKVRPTIEELKKRYGKDVRWVGKQLVVHPQTATASALAICAASKQKKFAAMDHLLWEQGYKARQFDKNNCWDDPAGCSIVDGFARKAGLDGKKFRDDMRQSCQTWLRSNDAALKKLGGAATPTFFINGRHLSGAQPVASFAALIDEELSRAKARVAQGQSRGGYYDKWVVEEGQPELDP